MANLEWGCEIPTPTISVVGDGFCVPYPVELIVKKRRIFEDAHYRVFHINGNLFLQVIGSLLNLNFTKKRVMRDAAGSPIITMHKKLNNPSKFQWTVHRGEGAEEKSLLFTVVRVRPQPFRMRKQLDVLLANNSSERLWDFRVIGCYFSQSFKVFKGNSVIAEVNQEDFTWRKFWKARNSKPIFRVSINPNVDYAFIVTLIVIFHEN